MVEFVLITAATWVCTVALLAAVIISIAWLAFRARRHDVPEILAGLGRMVAPLGGWLPSRRRAASIVPCKFCHAVLRKALEPRKRGRPASYCDAGCRTAAAKDPAAPKWLTGYVGTCKNYQHGCKCLRKDEIAFEDDLVILTPSKEILILGTAVGHLGVQPDADDPATTVWLNAILRPYERGLLSRSAGMPIEFVPTADVARHTAIRLCASALRREGGIRRVLITVPDRPAKLVAQGFGFRTAATKRHASGTMVWDLDRHAPPPTHVVA